jgi:hypothetical protein
MRVTYEYPTVTGRIKGYRHFIHYSALLYQEQRCQAAVVQAIFQKCDLFKAEWPGKFVVLKAAKSSRQYKNCLDKFTFRNSSAAICNL